MEVTYSLKRKRDVTCRVRLPVDACLEELRNTLADTPPQLQGELAPLVRKFESLTESSEVVDLDPLQERDFSIERCLADVAAGVLEGAIGFAWCPVCNHEFVARGTIFERWERGRWSLEGGRGRRFYCGRSQHLLFEVVDFRS